MSRPPLDIAAYEANDGYQSVKTISGGLNPADVMQIVKDSGLKGRGGAGFPTGLKPLATTNWRPRIRNPQTRNPKLATKLGLTAER